MAPAVAVREQPRLRAGRRARGSDPADAIGLARGIDVIGTLPPRPERRLATRPPPPCGSARRSPRGRAARRPRVAPTVARPPRGSPRPGPRRGAGRGAAALERGDAAAAGLEEAQRQRLEACARARPATEASASAGPGVLRRPDSRSARGTPDVHREQPERERDAERGRTSRGASRGRGVPRRGGGPGAPRSSPRSGGRPRRGDARGGVPRRAGGPRGTRTRGLPRGTAPGAAGPPGQVGSGAIRRRSSCAPPRGTLPCGGDGARGQAAGGGAGKSPSSFARRAGSRRVPAAAAFSTTCSGRVAPTTTASTPGCARHPGEREPRGGHAPPRGASAAKRSTRASVSAVM